MNDPAWVPEVVDDFEIWKRVEDHPSDVHVEAYGLDASNGGAATGVCQNGQALARLVATRLQALAVVVHRMLHFFGRCDVGEGPRSTRLGAKSQFIGAHLHVDALHVEPSRTNGGEAEIALRAL
jgi:hypothetical protein